jgi:phage baseplate assembly protein W
VTDRIRSLRFCHPDEHASPGLRVSASGALETVSEAAAVRQALLLLLTTRPGERVMRPHYGTRLHELMFALRDETTAGLAIHYVESAVRRWEPRVEVLKVDAQWDPAQPSSLLIHLSYRMRHDRARYALSWELEVSTEV